LKHVEDSNKRIIEEVVRQVGHLPEQRNQLQSLGTSGMIILKWNGLIWIRAGTTGRLLQMK
jgi:hypothetical protein